MTVDVVLQMIAMGVHKIDPYSWNKAKLFDDLVIFSFLIDHAWFHHVVIQSKEFYPLITPYLRLRIFYFKQVCSRCSVLFIFLCS